MISAPPVTNRGLHSRGRGRTPPLELESAASMHANRIRMNEAAARMAPGRDHNFALRRWLKSPIVVPEEDSADLSSYERSASLELSASTRQKKKKKKKKTRSKDNSNKNDGYESPPAPFREKLSNAELTDAIKKVLREGDPVSHAMYPGFFHSPRSDSLSDLSLCNADVGEGRRSELHDALSEICAGASRRLPRDHAGAWEWQG